MPNEELAALLRKDEELASVLSDAERRRLQILVTVPEEGGVVRKLGFRVDTEYFYPASSVKLCAAFAAMEKLDELRSQRGLSSVALGTRLRFVTGEGRARRAFITSLRTELEKALVVSDNEAYDRLFDFVGPGELSFRLSRAGLQSARIAHHLGRPEDAPLPSIELLPRNHRAVPIAQRADVELPPAPSQLLVGSSHVDANGHVVPGPMDFAAKNIISLRDLHYLLIALARPDLSDRAKPILRNDEDRKRLLAILGMLPSDLTGEPRRHTRRLLPDAAYKPLHVAIVNALPNDTVRVYGKGGRAFGFFVESSYAVDETTGRSFFVTATIYANDNDTLNDDRYDYDSLASPFMTRLGQVLARELLTNGPSAAR